MASSKETGFFDMFIEAVECSYRAATLLDDMLNDYVNVTAKAERIHKVEHEADQKYHRLYEDLNHAFITPIEREDIYNLGQFIDDITDKIEDVANLFDMLNIEKTRPGAKQMSALIVKTVACLLVAVKEFRHFKKSKTLTPLIVEVGGYEEEGDRIFRGLMKELFVADERTLDIMKWKEIYETMEDVLDACADVADVMQGVMMKNS